MFCCGEFGDVEDTLMMEVGEVMEFFRQTCRRRRGGSTWTVLYVECGALVIDDFPLKFGEVRKSQFVLRFGEWKAVRKSEGTLSGLVAAGAGRSPVVVVRGSLVARGKYFENTAHHPAGKVVTRPPPMDPGMKPAMPPTFAMMRRSSDAARILRTRS